MPGMCLPIEDGGIGFDYRLAMGLPDMWIKATKTQDEFWDINKMWGDMCLRRPGENSVAYVESHDQALVGDKTMIFRLADANMYTDMEKSTHNLVIDRAIALPLIYGFYNNRSVIGNDCYRGNASAYKNCGYLPVPRAIFGYWAPDNAKKDLYAWTLYTLENVSVKGR